MSTIEATTKKIWLSSPHMGGKEQDYVNEAFRTNWIAPLGPNVQGFEDSIENFLGEDVYVAALSSGTAAIHLALKLAGVTTGDSVLCQSFTFSASANPILYLGAQPIFIDSEKDTWNMCPVLLEEALVTEIAKGKKPKAIIAVHLYGMPFKLEIIRLGKKYGVPVIEDSAEALGSSLNGVKCGLLGDYGIFSFNGNKIITTSGGGAMVTKSEDDKRKVIHWATQSREDAVHYQHEEVGYNYRMSNVLAGIGRGQMQVLTDRVDARRKNHELYLSGLSEVPNISFLYEPEGFHSNRWLSCILTDSFISRERIRLALAKENIESRPLWKPMHLQPVFKDNYNYTSGVSEDLFERGLCLPSGTNLTPEDLYRIIAIVKKNVPND